MYFDARIISNKRNSRAKGSLALTWTVDLANVWFCCVCMSTNVKRALNVRQTEGKQVKKGNNKHYHIGLA